ncbi:MAG TPA: LodA/GoxA family CTQ-dependent oxidase [Pyrinomonadaceae bacterium]|nr:LodA/GoxA family CTQ-dependent oxidase [Pyrinomonadaceae bacterium]
MKFKIHPAIGIARLGDSTNSFYLAPEEAGQLPIDCDQDGNALLDSTGAEQTISNFKDSQQRVRRQGARFRVYTYDDNGQNGREVKIGQSVQMVNQKNGQLMEGKVVDIEWTVYLANKKASWYEFHELKGEHGYDPTHPLRNADITDPDARNQLIIDPGPQTVSYTNKKARTATFARGANPGYTQTFPPPLQPFSIDTLGELKVTQQNKFNRLVVLGGYGNSGSFKTGFGQPVITAYANNDGWFDDTSDGPVLARIKYQVTSEDGRPPDAGKKPVYLYANVDESAWVIVGYPRFAPQILDIITLDEVVYDVSVREFGYHTYVYGLAPFDGTHAAPDPTDANALALWRKQATWNQDYYPYFNRDIWPLLQRPNNYQNVMDFDPFTGGDPHDTSSGTGGNFDPTLLSVPPHEGEDPALREKRRRYRMHIWSVLRQPGKENLWTVAPDPANPKYGLVAMPFLCGDNPITNTTPSKFLRLTDTQLFILGQWAAGKFINETEEDIPSSNPEASAKTGVDLDRGVLSNLLGGSFCPGGEASWIIRNPAIYRSPYRINLDPNFALNPLGASLPQPLVPVGQPLNTSGDLSTGLQPGDLTKYSALPWQSDFNECATQTIDITYEQWNETYPSTTGDPVQPIMQNTYWWPSHRPMTVFMADYTQTPPAAGPQVQWSQGIPQTNQGDLKMVTAWKYLGFIRNLGTDDNPAFVQVERNDAEL